MKNISSAISNNRKSKGYTQEQLAEKAKVNLRTIQRIESGESRPSAKSLILVCEALNINYEDFHSRSVQGSIWNTAFNIRNNKKMNTQLRSQYLDYSLIGIAIILTFISLKSIGTTLSLLLLPLIALYFFPGKLLFIKGEQSSSNKIYTILSSFILGYLVTMAALANYLQEIPILRTICLASALLNFVFLLVVYFRRDNNKVMLFSHLLASFLCSVILYT